MNSHLSSYHLRQIIEKNVADEAKGPEDFMWNVALHVWFFIFLHINDARVYQSHVLNFIMENLYKYSKY